MPVMRRIWPYGLLTVLAVMHFYTLRSLTAPDAAGDMRESPLYALPAPIMKIAALDYDGIVSDFLLMEGLVYIGANLQQTGHGAEVRLRDAQWQWFHGVMQTTADLDPYFQDPYYTANAFLSWDAGMAREATALLEQGSRYRDWDWALPFLAGFNYFYLLQENDKAVEFLMESYRRPGSSPLLASIASKLAYKEGKTAASIALLKELLRNTDDELEKRRLTMRLDALREIGRLEEALAVYRRRFKRAPAGLEDLVASALLDAVPADPLGGRFYLDPAGAVRSTSERLLMPARRQ